MNPARSPQSTGTFLSRSHSASAVAATSGAVVIVDHTTTSPTGTKARAARWAERGVEELVRKVEAARPAVVALVGITLARIVLPGSGEAGPGSRTTSIGGARV